MSPFPLGILAASGGVEAVAAYDLLETTTLASDASSVSFNGLQAYTEYKHLQVRIQARSRRASGSSGDTLALRINNDTGNNYANHALRGDDFGGFRGLSFSVPNGDSIRLETVTADNAEANENYGSLIVDLLDSFENSKNKTVRSFGGRNAGISLIGLGSGFRNNTEPITSLEFFAISANTAAGSKFSLYGIKG